MKKIIDISVTISPRLVVWAGDPPVRMEQTSRIEEGAVANVTSLQLGAHTGTHLDAPCHFIPGGSSVEQINLALLLGRVQVVVVPEDATHISASVLETLPLEPGVERILFKTSNSGLWRSSPGEFVSTYVALGPDGAQYLLDRGVKVIGVDYLSAAAYDSLEEVHRQLLGRDVILLEGLDLSETEPGIYLLVCLPLKLQGADGAPMRAVLAPEDYFC